MGVRGGVGGVIFFAGGGDSGLGVRTGFLGAGGRNTKDFGERLD